MVNRSSYPKNFFKANEIIYNVAGLWLHNDTEVPRWRKYLQILWTSMEYINAAVFLILEIIILNETSKDINKFFSHIGLLLSHCLGILKGVILVLRHNKLRKIINVMHDQHYHYEAFDDFNPALTFFEAKKLSQICTISIFSLYTLVGVFAHISTASTIHREVRDIYFQEQYKCQDYMPYYFLIPFEIDTKIKCDYILVFMDYSLCVYAWMVACYDSFFVALLNCLKTHLVILRDAIKLIRKRVLKRVNLDQNMDVFHDESLPIFEQELYREFCHLIKHLTILLRTAEELEGLFNFMILAQTLTSLFNVASCLFTAAKVPVGSPEFFATLQYFVCMLLELALVCWFGSGITRASEEIMLALYTCEWLSTSKRFKKSLVITMCRMQKPIYLTIGKFFPLTLGATVSVCKASFSYYTVFRRVDE